MSDQERKQLAEKADRYFRLLAEADKTFSHGAIDPRAVVSEVGKDPARLARWVRDNTVLVPYEGVLRGAVGVLMDRVGNSLDRALLLHSLLRAAGLTARLARGRLSDEQLAAVVAQLRTLRRHESAPSGPRSSREAADIVREYVQQRGFDPTELSAAAAKVYEDHTDALRTFSAQVADQTAAILARVSPLRRNDARPPVDPAEALRDHWWVQISEKGKWADLDPVQPEARIRSALTVPVRTIGAAALPNALFHRVTLRVVAERSSGSSRAEQTILEASVRAADLAGKSLTLRPVSVGLPNELALLAEKDPLEAFRNHVLDETEWQIDLLSGSRRLAQASIDASGNTKRSSQRTGPGVVGGVAGGVLGGMAGSGSSANVESPSQLTAAWVDYVVRSPGRDARTVRRQIFDLVGPAERQREKASPFLMTERNRLDRGLAMLRQTWILVQGSEVPAAFVAHLIASALVANRGGVLDFLRAGPSASVEDLTERLARITPLPGPELMLAAARRMLADGVEGVYLDRPNVISYARGLHADPAGDISAYQGYDVIANEVAVAPSSGADPFAVRLRQGVGDTNAELLSLARSGGPVQNTAAFFGASSGAGAGWIAVRTAADPAWQRVVVPADVRARVNSDLAEGYIAVIPSQPVRTAGAAGFGWWRVNPVTGDTLGMGPEGSGQATTARVILEKILFIAHVASPIVCVIEIEHLVKKKMYGAARALLLDCPMLVAGGFALHFALEIGGAALIMLAIFHILFEILSIIPAWVGPIEQDGHMGSHLDVPLFSSA